MFSILSKTELVILKVEFGLESRLKWIIRVWFVIWSDKSLMEASLLEATLLPTPESFSIFLRFQRLYKEAF